MSSLRSTTFSRGQIDHKRQRADDANRLIAVIANCGRRFFPHEGAISHFSVDDRGRVWFVDHYSKKRIYTHTNHRWRGFTNGGTMRGLIERLRDYIRTGERQRLGLGPWSQWICDGDLWGYADDMESVRASAIKLGIQHTTAGPAGNEDQ